MAIARPTRQAAALLLALALAAGADTARTAPGDAANIKAQEGGAALMRGNALHAVSLFTEALNDPSLANDRRALILNDRGVAYMRLRQSKQSIEDFNRAAQLFPEYAAIYNNRGNLLLALGNDKEAIKDFDRAIVLAPGYAAAYNNRASALIKAGDIDAAVADYSRAIELAPNSAAPLNGRGRAQLQAGRTHAAVRDFSRAVTLDAKYGAGLRNRAEAHIELERYGEAIDDLTRAVGLEPNSAEIHLVRGNAYILARNYPAAIRDFTRATELDGRLAAAYELRGFAHAKAGAFDDALKDLGRAIEIDHRLPGPYAKRAYAYSQMSQPEAGLRDVERALKLDAQSPEALWVRGEILLALGRIEEAVTDLRAAVAARPGLRDATDTLARITGERPREDRLLAEGGFERWRVAVTAGRYYAVNDQYPQLRVPLEMMSKAQPRITDWELKRPPFRGIGVLRFTAGAVKSKNAMEEVEHAAVIDLTTSTVIGIGPYRQGDRLAKWEWDEEGTLTVAADGVTDVFALKADRSRLASRLEDKNRPPGVGPPPGWQGPWDERFANRQAAQRPSGSGSGGSRKPKTLFDLLFGN